MNTKRSIEHTNNSGRVIPEDFSLEPQPYDFPGEYSKLEHVRAIGRALQIKTRRLWKVNLDLKTGGIFIAPAANRLVEDKISEEDQNMLRFWCKNNAVPNNTRRYFIFSDEIRPMMKLLNILILPKKTKKEEPPHRSLVNPFDLPRGSMIG